MSRRDRRHAKQDAKKFVPSKKKSLGTWVVVALAVIAVVFYVGTMLIQRG